jgi:glycosyltransferase involved in cell wall biosynthesis
MCRWIETRACQLATVRITKSAYAQQAWAAYLHCPTSQFDVIPNGIETELFESRCPRQAKISLGLPDDKLIIGTTARLELEKGVQVFLQAAKILAHSNRQLHFVVTGDGSLSADMRASIEKSGLTDRITMLGHQEDIPTVTAAYDVAVVPSVWNEPFGWVVLEAMAAGKPVIASRVGGIPEIVTHDKSGLLIKPNSATDLIAAIHTLMHDPTRRAAMGERGHERVVRRFGRADMIRRTTALYERLTSHTSHTQMMTNRTPGETVTCGPR